MALKDFMLLNIGFFIAFAEILPIKTRAKAYNIIKKNIIQNQGNEIPIYGSFN